jgi:hypothetical protein
MIPLPPVNGLTRSALPQPAAANRSVSLFLVW